ncbi:uncharacterized protein [Hetaerina americana]|uniref:uncharacterized protein n=1 Tax=Hetaerina americana TaxID=62018 RepID=UPI003A7F2085
MDAAETLSSSLEMSGKDGNRKREKSWDEAAMKAAAGAFLSGEMSARGAALKYKIPSSTLRRRLMKIIYANPERNVASSRIGRRRIFTDEQERELINFLNKVERMSFGMNRKQCRVLVYWFAESQGIPHHFSRSTKMAGTAWFKEFTERHNFHLGITRGARGPTRHFRAGLGLAAVKQFFDILGEVREEKKLTACRIYHAISMGFSTFPIREQEDASANGSNPTPDSSSIEGGRSVSVLCCASATGDFIPPFLVYPGRKLNIEFLMQSPPGSSVVLEETGSLTEIVFTAFLGHYVDHVGSSPDTPTLLLVDNQPILVSPAVIDFAQRHGIILMGFPSSVPYKLQPLSLTFVEVFRSFFVQVLDISSLSHPESRVAESELAGLFGYAFLSAAVPENVVQGFKNCGIEPFNPEFYRNISEEH